MFRQTQTPPQSRSQSRPGGLQTEKTTSLENSQPLETSDSQSATEEPSASLDKMEDDDQSSTTSSLEIVDALTEAAEDLTSRFEDADRSSSSPSLPMDLVLVGLPSEEGGLQGGLNFSQDQMTASQYSQVVFHDVADTYPSECDIHCRYTLTRGLQAGHGDRVALYRLPYLQPHEYITFVWAPVPPTVETLENSSELEVTFALSSLPAEDDFYQFQYLQGDSIVAGASVPFQLRGQGAGKLCSDIKSDEIQVMCDVDTRDLTKDSLDGKVVSMESKYTDLLALSEQLSEELSQKQQSFVILEMEHKSMLEVATRAKELEADMRSLVEEKLGLEQTLEQTNETLHQGESLLSTTTTRMTEATDLLKMKVEQVLVLEEALARSEAKCGAASSDIQALVEERDKLAVMLQKEIESREVLLQQKTELVERLEDTGNMLNAASKSKDLAVEEIRCQVQLQDRIRKELAVAREEAGVAEADLVTVRQELDRCKKELQLVSEGQKEEVKCSQGDEVKGSQGEEVRGDDLDSDSLAVASVLSSLGARLEAKERELRQKEEELQLLRQVEGQSVEIHEKCLEDADKRALEQENENKQLVADIGRLGEKLRGVEEENLDLRRRLEAGAKHYRKLAQDKERLEKEMEGEEVDGLKSKISELETEVSQLRLEQQGASCNSQASSMTRAWTGLMDHQVVNSGSQASSMTRAWTGLGMSDGESINNMDSIKINEAVTSGSGDRLPSLLHPARPTAPVTVQPMAAPLPCPLVPDNVDPTILPPELRPRAPAPYSLSSCRSNDVSDGGSLTGSEPASQTITEPVSPAVSQPGSMVTELENQTIPVEDVVIAPDEDKCPLCDLVLPLGSVMEQHVEQHLNNMVNCPVCSKAFPQEQQQGFEEHVQGHFQEEENQQDLHVRGWDLGID